jgi:predicted nuclease with RNAse H fold
MGSRRRCVGIDVSEKRGLDLVLLDDSLRVVGSVTRADSTVLAHWLGEWRPRAVAIDSPPFWGIRGGSRKAERELLRLGIRSYATPSDPQKRRQPFYAWMEKGFEAFEVCARAGYRLYRRGEFRRHAIEVFPHASAVVLAGCLPPGSATKAAWRRSILQSRGVDTTTLRSLELVDAALAALTGVLALRGEASAVGDPTEGVIVVPSKPHPTTRFRRGETTTTPARQPKLPGLAPCQCGDPACRETTSGEFAPAHAAKRKTLLWNRLRAGEESRAELKRRGWELPPELR